MSRVLIGDFNPVMRLGLCDLLAEAGCEVVAEDVDGDLVDRLTRILPEVADSFFGGLRRLDSGMDSSSQDARGDNQPWVISRWTLRGEVRRKPTPT